MPMRNHENDIIGVLQLINAVNPVTKQVEAFSGTIQRLAESLASQAAVALTNHQLVEDLRRLLEKIIEVIADAIDEKSPYTGGHCKRVPEVARMLAEAAHRSEHGIFADFRMETQEQWQAFNVSAWLHDCGKVTTPEYVVDKASKLETLYNRIHEIRTRCEVLWRDAELDYYRSLVEGIRDEKQLR